MRSAAIAWMLTVAMSACGCATGPQPSASAVTADGGGAVTGGGSALLGQEGNAGNAIDAELAAQFEWAHDYRRFAGVQASLGRWAPEVTRPTSGAFVFLRGFDRFKYFSMEMGSDNHLVFGTDGTLAASVVLPGFMVAEADVERLRKLLDSPGRDGYPRLSGRARHAFVVFSNGGARQVAINFEAQRWFGDGIRGNEPDAEVMEELRGICERSGAPLCGLGTPKVDEAHSAWLQSEYEQSPDGLFMRRRSRPLEIDGEKSIAALSDAERRLSCVWNLEHVTSNAIPKPGRWIGHADGVSVRSLSWRECVDRFPTCDTSVGVIAACQEVAQKGDVWLHETAEGRACAHHRSCMWGFEWSFGAEAP